MPILASNRGWKGVQLVSIAVHHSGYHDEYKVLSIEFSPWISQNAVTHITTRCTVSGFTFWYRLTQVVSDTVQGSVKTVVVVLSRYVTSHLG